MSYDRQTDNYVYISYGWRVIVSLIHKVSLTKVPWR